MKIQINSDQMDVDEFTENRKHGNAAVTLRGTNDNINNKT